jgi:cyclophilin family peptidyl-prolyl cis-trans isomerase
MVLSPSDSPIVNRCSYGSHFPKQKGPPSRVENVASESGSEKMLKAELSDVPLRRVVVGMKHALNAPDTADSQFFIILGAAPHLGGKYTVWGGVIHGLGLTDLLSRGSPPGDPDKVHSLRVAADVKH